MAANEADRLLVAQVRGGEEDAWNELIGRFEGRLQAFVQSRLGDSAGAEDVVQETFLGFLTSLPNYDDRTPLEVFLFSIAAHKLTDALRRGGRRSALPLSSSGAGNARTASSIVRSREGHGLETTILGNCLRDLIQAWIDRGEFERLRCIELLFVLGWSNKAVARELEISEQAVANHKHFVVSKLKEAAHAARLKKFDSTRFGISPD